MSILDELYGPGAGGTVDPTLQRLMIQAELARRLQEATPQTAQAGLEAEPPQAGMPQPMPPPAPVPQPAGITSVAKTATPRGDLLPVAPPKYSTPAGSNMHDVFSYLQGKDTPDRAMQELTANQTAAALKAKGYSDADIMAAITNPQVGPTVFTEAFSPNTMTVNPGQVVINKSSGRALFDNTDKKPTLVGPAHTAIVPDPSAPGGWRAVASGGLTEGDRTKVEKLTEQLQAVTQARVELQRAAQYAKDAYSGPMAGASTFLTAQRRFGKEPTSLEQSANATNQLDQIARGAALQQAKAQAGGRATVYIDRAYTALAPNSSMDPLTRQTTLERTAHDAEVHEKELRDQIEAIKTGKMYTPGNIPGIKSVGPAGGPAGGGADPLGLR